MKRARGNKQRRVHFHERRKIIVGAAKLQKAVCAAFSECVVGQQVLDAQSAFYKALRVPNQPIQGRFIVFPVKRSRESARIEREMEKEALKLWRVHGDPVARGEYIERRRAT